jgi:CBS domain-containing protein
MRVQEIMTRNVRTCSPDSPLNEAARIMWERDCGFVPVTEPGSKKLCGVVTDRDICMAAYTRNTPLTDIRVGAVMSRKLETCRAEDDVSVACDRMRERQIRRLPVTDGGGHLVGLIALNDLALAAAEGKDRTMPQRVAATLGGISRHRGVAATV